MVRRVVIVLLMVFVLFGVFGLFITLLQRSRYEAHLEMSRNNLRNLALFAAQHVAPKPGADPAKRPLEIPPATVPLLDIPPDDRLSWVVYLLPTLDQQTHPTAELLEHIQRDLPWSAEANQEAAKTRLPVLLCPENTPEMQANSPAVTCYVGIAGVGADAATLSVPPGLPPDPQAGPFHYDGPTPFDFISDGLSQTMLIAETANEPGPWLQGGFSTSRGVIAPDNAKPLVGMDGQFGGYFPNIANIALCDGSVRTFTAQTAPDVFLGMATIAGGDAVGE